MIFEYDGSKEDLAYDKFYVVFDSAQIKSATDNIGTFDKTNPDIRYSSQEGRYRDLMGGEGGEVHQRNTMRISQNKEIPFQNWRGISLSMHDHPNYAVHKNNAFR